MSALALLLAVLASISTAGEQTAVAVFKTRFVPPRRVDVSKAKELPDLAGVWIWTTDTPPQRTDASLKTAPAPSASLTVRIETSATPPTDLTLLAAPAAMWEEVSEPLLPSFKVEFGKDRKAVVHVPVDAKTPWRLRLKGSGSGSWWIDVPPGQRQTTLALVAAPDHAIEVRGEDGKPVAEAAVTVLEEGTLRGAFRKLADFRTEERGRLLFAGLPDSASPTILFGAAGRAPNVYITNPSRIPAIVTLRRGHRVTGNVRNRSGAPVAGASIEVRVPISPTLPALPVLREAKSDAEGRWDAGALPDGEGSWQIAAPAFATVTGRVKFDKDVVDLGTITLEPGVKVEVQVNDDRGMPVAGAGIYTGDRTLATTNEKGHATVTLAPKESILMRAGAKHHHFAAKTVRATDRLVTFVLTRPFRITGRFVDSAGLPVMDTKVSAHRGNMSVFPNDGRIDDGRFDLQLDSDGEYDLELSSSRTSTARVHVKPGALGEVRDLGDIVAPSALTVTGRLLRAGDASPVAGAHVWALRPSPEGIVSSWSLRNIAETTSAADGTFTLSGLLLQSPFDLRVDAPSLAPVRKSLTPVAASDHVDAGDITLAAGATVVIRLQNDTGEDASGRVHTGGMFFSREPLNAPFENGVARVTGVPPGPALVSASRRRDILCQQKVTIPESGDDVEIICNARKVTIAGTVTVGGSPAGRGTIFWRQGPHDFQSAMQDPYYSPDHPQERVEIGPDGRFEGLRLIPGVWDVMWMPELGREYAPKTITVTDIDVQNVTLEYPGVSVDGIVLDANRRPVKAAMVRDLGRQGFALTHDDGTFTLGGPEPGTWRLQARFADQASAVKEVVVEDRPERPHVELVLGAGESNVRVAAGRGAMVFLDVDSGLLQMASTDDSGIATFHLQPPLPTRVRVAATASGRWALGDWIDWSEAMGAPLELKMPEAGNIVLHTKGAAGPVTVTSTNGWRIDRLFQWAGAFLRLASGSDVTVTGLPTGSYTITVSNEQRTASVERDKTLEITFD